MNNLSRFIKATDFTKDCFNKWGYEPYDAILETCINEYPYAPYDLTILIGDPSSVYGKHYLIATGTKVYPFVFKTVNEAADALINQYHLIRREVAENV